MHLNVILAPGQGRPPMRTRKVRADLSQAAKLTAHGGHPGVAALTEYRSRRYRRQLHRLVPGHYRGPKPGDCPIIWSGLRLLESGVDYGCGGIGIIAPARHTTWTRLRHPSGLTLGVIAAHTLPGGWRPGTRAQRRNTGRIKAGWRAHERRITRRQHKLMRTCDLVITLGDFNRPGTYAIGADHRISGRGLMYAGIQHHGHLRVTVGRRHHAHQHADHPVWWWALTIKEGQHGH